MSISNQENIMDTNTFMFKKMQPTKLFIKCAIPATLSMIFSGIYSIADGIFVGRCIGADALAAVNLVMPLIMISFALAEMIAVGSSVQLAMLLGQKEKELANRTFSVCIKVILGISVIIGLIFFFLSKPILMLMGTEGVALQYSIEYIRIYAVFSPLIIVYFAADNYLRICGKQNYSMALCPFFRNKLELKFVKGWISAKQFMKLVANGSSEFFANIASSIFSFILNIVLLSIGGATAVAAMSVVMYVESIASMMISGMSDSMQPAISYCYGAGLKKRVYALEKRVLVSAAVLSLIACLLLRYGGAWVAPFFVKSDETELLALSIQAMSLYALSYLVNWVDGCLSGYLTALGQAGRSFIVSIMGALVLPLVGLAVLVPPLGLAGVCLMPLFAGVLSAVLSLVLVLTIKNKSV